MSTNTLEIKSHMTLHTMLEDRIEIPIIQRDYAQGRKNVKEIRKDFLKDIFSHLSSNNAMKLSFVYGTRNGGIYVPYDGQQRLTLIYLITLYLAAYCEDWNSIRELSKFNYYTRDYATAFCAFLTGFDSEHDEGRKNIFQRIDVKNITSCSEAITNDSGFFGSWKYEPTVASMLVVLQAIHDEFLTVTARQDAEEKCKNARLFLTRIEEGKIFFDWCPIQASDNIYIKMNGRGKPLSAFDNFKNTLYSELDKLRERALRDGQKNKVDFVKDFEIKMDGIWTDTFWSKRDLFENKENYNIAPFMMNFLYYIFEFRHFVSGENFFFGGRESFRWINEKNVVTFLTKFKELCQEDSVGKKGEITIDDFIWASKLLDIVSSRLTTKDTDISLFRDAYYDEAQIFKELSAHVGRVASSQTIIVSALYYEYLVAVSEFDNYGKLIKIDVSNREEWIKLISRLMKTAGTFKARYDSLVRDKHILAGYSNLFIPKVFKNNQSGDLLIGAKNITPNDLVGMKKYFDLSHMYSQLVEEIMKYKLIELNASVWKPLLKQAEDELSYFGNMIYFMLEISKDSSGSVNALEFAKYLKILKKVIDGTGVRSQNKVTALMLSYADYRIAYGEGYSNSLSLCSNESPSDTFSWRSFFDVLDGDICERGKRKVDVIKELLDYLEMYNDIDSGYQAREKKPTKFSWRDVIVNYPDVLNTGSRHRIVHMDDGSHYLIRSEGVVKQVHANSLNDSTNLELYGLFKESSSPKIRFEYNRIVFDGEFYVFRKEGKYYLKDHMGERIVTYEDALEYLNAL